MAKTTSDPEIEKVALGDNLCSLYLLAGTSVYIKSTL
jgi:hypothetical protein